MTGSFRMTGIRAMGVAQTRCSGSRVQRRCQLLIVGHISVPRTTTFLRQVHMLTKLCTKDVPRQVEKIFANKRSVTVHLITTAKARIQPTTLTSYEITTRPTAVAPIRPVPIRLLLPTSAHRTLLPARVKTARPRSFVHATQRALHQQLVRRHRLPVRATLSGYWSRQKTTLNRS